MDKMLKKNFGVPDETRRVPKATVEVLKLNDTQVIRNTFEPGWRWSESVKPIAKTETCQVYHLLYILSGRLGASMADGSVAEFGPGEVGVIPPGHDGWVIGNEACVNLDFGGSKVYAKAAS
jgi:hypothetical protein